MFVEDRITGFEVDLVDIFSEMFQLVRLKAFKERDTGQALRFFA